MHPTAAPLTLTRSGPEFKDRPADYFIRGPHRPSFGDTPLYDTPGGRTPAKSEDHSVNVILGSYNSHHPRRSHHQPPKSVSALARFSDVGHHQSQPHHDDYDHYSHPFGHSKADSGHGGSSSQQSSPEAHSHHHVHVHPPRESHDHHKLHEEHHHHQHHHHHSHHHHHDHERKSQHGEGDVHHHKHKSLEPKATGVAFAKTMQQLHAYMSNLGFQGDAAKGQNIQAMVEEVETFPTKRLVSVHGERLLTALRHVCQKLEILAVLPQIMSRLAIGDEELEAVLGSECTEAVLQLLYIQMAWLEYRCPQPLAASSFMGKTIHEIKRRLQKGVRARMSKLKFPSKLAESRETAKTTTTRGSISDATINDGVPAPPATKVSSIAKHEHHRSPRKPCSKDKKHKRKKKKYTDPFTDEEREELREFIDKECSRTELRTNRTMQGVMKQQALVTMKETTEVKVFHDIFYDSLRNYPAPPKKPKPAVERQLEKLRMAQKKKKHRPDCRKCLKDPKKCLRYDTKKKYQQIAGHCYYTVFDGEDAEVNPLDEFLTDTDYELLPEEDEEQYLNCIRGAALPRSQWQPPQSSNHRASNLTETSDSELEYDDNQERSSRKRRKKSETQDQDNNEVKEEQEEDDSRKRRKKRKSTAKKVSVTVRPLSVDSGNRFGKEDEMAGEEWWQGSAYQLSNSNEYPGEDEAAHGLRKSIVRRKRKSKRRHSAPGEQQSDDIYTHDGDSKSHSSRPDDKSKSGYNASSEGAHEKRGSISSPSRQSHETQSMVSTMSYYTGESEPGEGHELQKVRRQRVIASLLKDPTKSKFLRQLVGADSKAGPSSATRLKLQNKRLALVKRALDGPYGTYVRRALREKNVKELLFLIHLDRNARDELAVDESGRHKSEAPIPSAEVPLHIKKQTWRERWYGQSSERQRIAEEQRSYSSRGWRLVRDPRSGRLALIKHYKDNVGLWKSVRIRLNAKNQPETMTERKQRRLAKVEKRLERERRIQELQKAYGKQIPRIAYERYNKERQDTVDSKKKCKTEPDCDQPLRLSSDESATSSEDDGDYTVIVTDPYPYNEPVKNRRGLEDICLRKRPTSTAAESIGIPDKSESAKLGSIRVISANYNIGRMAAMERPWIGPELFGISADRYHSDQLQQAYREVLRVLSLNDGALKWINRQIRPEVTQAVKIFYVQIQILQGLMYARLLMTPEEEITRIHYLKQTWIREQRLLRLLQALQDELHKLEKEREDMMVSLNESINSYIGQIDHAYLQSHQEISRTIAEYTKMELVTTKSADQALQELHGTLQKCIQVASIMRAKYAEAEDKLNKQKLKLGADLEALIGQYDSEMFARQEVLDQLLLDEQANKDELTAIEKRLQKVEMRYNVMQEEDRLREAAERVRQRSKKGKGKKGKKGSKGKGKKGKKKGGSKGKGKGKKGKGGGKKGKKGKKKKKGGASSGEDESEFEEGDDTTEAEQSEAEDAEPKKKKGKKSKSPAGGAKKGGKGKKGKGKKGAPAAAPTSEEEGEDDEEEATEGEGEDEAAPAKAKKTKKGKGKAGAAEGATAEPEAKKERKGKKKKAADEDAPPEAAKAAGAITARPSAKMSKAVIDDDDALPGDFDEPPTPPNESVQGKKSVAAGGDKKGEEDDEGKPKKKGKKKGGKKKSKKGKKAK